MDAVSPWGVNSPIRAEIFGPERLEQHARSLAVAQVVTVRSNKGDPLTRRLAENGDVLLDAYRGLASSVENARPITPAAEWLIDNYHLVERQIHAIRSDLPPDYYRQLPKLVAGPLAGYPRILGMAWAYVAHSDSAFSPVMLNRFIRAYQEIQPLTLGELWAASITLRIVLIENLRRLAQQIMVNRAAQEDADVVADRLLGRDGAAGEPLALVQAQHQSGDLAPAFAIQLVHRLRDQDPFVTPALAWLDERLAGQGTDLDLMVQELHGSEGAANVTVRNIITSLRLIADVDWNDMVESVSLVDGVLSAGSDFGRMDFVTRNLYRNAVEELARHSPQTELEVARLAVAAAQLETPDRDERRADPGYYLLADGRLAFERRIGFRPPLRAWPSRLTRASGIGGYVAAVAMVTASLLAIPLILLAALGMGTVGLVLLALLGLMPAQELAMAMVHRSLVCIFTPVPSLEVEPKTILILP